MGKRCFSKCRKKKEADCTAPCQFLTKGYCRLSSTLKMIPPSCEVVSKTKKGHRLCLDGVCLLDSLRLFFKQKTFEYEVKRENQGAEQWIDYRRGEYKAHALLQKSSVDAYLIGRGLRPYLSRVPLFVDTYGVFRGGKTAVLKRDCLKDVTVLTESLPGLKSLHSVHTPHFFIYDALYVFYQIYAALQRVPFTHGQLTCDSVMIYKLPGSLEFHYPEAVFQSTYLVKLVDYRHAWMEGVKRCVPVEKGDDLSLLKDYARVSRMKPHENKYIQGFMDVFQSAKTVSDAERQFRALIQDPVRERVNEKSQPSRKLGKLYVPMDQPMKYVSL
jgi:hypothetical protein